MSEEFTTVTTAGLRYDVLKHRGVLGNRHPYAIDVTQRQAPNEIAKMAFELITRWGAVAAAPDGEDSAGRSKLRLVEPKELVDRAFLCAEAAMETARDRGHMIELPSRFRTTTKKITKNRRGAMSTETFKCRIVSESDDAYRVEVYGKEAWIPKSQVERIKRDGDAAEMTIPAWLFLREFEGGR